MRTLSIATFFIAGLLTTSAVAQQPQTVRVRGTIEKADGSTLMVRAGEAGELKVVMTDNIQVFGIAKGTIADVKAGSFIGVGAMPQADGSQTAIQVVIFPEAMRGTGEGHRPWNRPGSTMTNATVELTVAGVDGQVVMVKYKDGEKKIVIPADAVIRSYLASDKNELKVGAAIAGNAVKKPDGSFEIARINVGRDGIVP